MQEIELTPIAAIVLIAIALWAAMAVKRLLKRGLCDCKDKCGGCAGCPRSGECESCANAGGGPSPTRPRADTAKEASHDTIS